MMRYSFRWSDVKGGHDNNRFGPPPSVQSTWVKWQPVLAMVRERKLLKPSCRLAIVCGRGVTLASEYRDVKQKLMAVAERQAKRGGWGPAEKGTPCELVGELYPPDRRRRDVLAYGKVLCDALQGSAYMDDSQVIDSRWLLREPDPHNPRIDILVQPVGVEQMGLGLDGGPERDRGFFDEG